MDKGERSLHWPTVTFIPATPGGKLTKHLREVLQEEGRRLLLAIKAVETGGVSLKRKLTGGDLAAGEPCRQPHCELFRSGLKGCGHMRSGLVYRGSCNICEDNNITAGDHTLLGFFLLQCSKPSFLALLSPKTNFVFIYKSQFHTNFNICDHIDLTSPTLFLETG